MSEQTIVGFNSNDFFYVSAQENNMMPTDASCVTILSEANENKYTQDNGDTIDYDFAIQCADLADEGITQGSDTGILNYAPGLLYLLGESLELSVRQQSRIVK